MPQELLETPGKSTSRRRAVVRACWAGIIFFSLVGCRPSVTPPDAQEPQQEAMARREKECRLRCLQQMTDLMNHYFAVIARHDVFLCVAPDDASEEVKQDLHDLEALKKQASDRVSPTNATHVRRQQIEALENPGLTTFAMVDFAMRRRQELGRLVDEVVSTLKTLQECGNISLAEWREILCFEQAWALRETAYREVLRGKLQGSISALLMEDYNTGVLAFHLDLLLSYLELAQS